MYDAIYVAINECNHRYSMIFNDIQWYSMIINYEQSYKIVTTYSVLERFFEL